MARRNFSKKYIPRCDVFQENGNFIIRLEMPGISREDLELHVEGSLLRIDAVKNLSNFEDYRYRMREIPDYDYHKDIPIDEKVDRDRIEADLSNGLLTLTFWEKGPAMSQKIAVNA